MAKDFKEPKVKKGLYVAVRENNISSALGELRRLMANEGWTKDTKRHQFFQTKGEIRRKANADARRRNKKELRESEELVSHDQVHHASTMKRGGTRRLRRLWDRGEGKFKKRDEENGYKSYNDYN